MASPFPGMDPFLESAAFWSDFHSRFVNAWCEAIADALPPQYEARIGERVYLVESDPDARKLGLPDVAVSHAPLAPAPGPVQTPDVATLEPVTIPLTILDGPSECYIEILHQPERSLVTVLELLSPANKELPGRTEYLAKRRALLYQQVHLVELDLLHRGRRLVLDRPLPPADYYYFVSRADRRSECQVYSWTLRHALPMLPVPLLPSDPDVFIKLGSVFATAYDRGRYRRSINYNGSLPGHLTPEDQAWATALLT